MKNIINLSLVLSILFFASCEGNTEYLLNVKNNSSLPITLKPNIDMGYNADNSETINIAIGETKQIAHWEQRGGESESVEILSAITTIYGTQHNNKELDEAAYRFAYRWVETIEEKKQRPANYSHTYVLTLQDSDFK